MPPKLKKKSREICKGATDVLEKGKRLEEEKENSLRLRGAKYTDKLPGEKSDYSECKTPQRGDRSKSQTIKVKPLGFWSKKLQDLEENEEKNKRHGLYEFSGTDESESSYKITKKRKPKARVQKKRQPALLKCNKVMAKTDKFLKPEKKTGQIHKKPLDEKQSLKKTLGRTGTPLGAERKQLFDEGKKVTFSMGMQSLGITSTPAINKDNLLGPSNFLFLSPIIKEDEHCKDAVECLPVDGSPLPVHLDVGTPKIQTKLKRLSCRRVLRNGKVLGT